MEPKGPFDETGVTLILATYISSVKNTGANAKQKILNDSPFPCRRKTITVFGFPEKRKEGTKEMQLSAARCQPKELPDQQFRFSTMHLACRFCD